MSEKTHDVYTGLHYPAIEELSGHDFTALIDKLSPQEAQQVRGIHNQKVALLTLIGKLLLRKLAIDRGLDTHLLNAIKLGPHGKPYVEAGEFHFNISHTKGAVICALSTSGPLGIDIERVRPIAAQKFKRFFTVKELTYIGQDENRFFELWSKKEALVKADGRGISMNPTTVEVLGTSAKTDTNDTWYMAKLNCDLGFKAFLATDFLPTSIHETEIDMADFTNLIA